MAHRILITLISLVAFLLFVGYSLAISGTIGALTAIVLIIGSLAFVSTLYVKGA